jgi:predicted transcriptional regulator
MKYSQFQVLSRREREIMDVIYRIGPASAATVRQGLPSPPSYSSVRTLLRILVEKGHLSRISDGHRYVYRPVVSRRRAMRRALDHVVQTFFEGSTANAVATLLDMDSALSEREIERLRAMMDKAGPQE